LTWGGGEEKFLTPNISPNFGPREPKFFVPIEFQVAHFCFEFQDPNPKIGVWGKNRKQKKIAFFNKGRLFQIYSQTTVLNVGTF